MTIRRWESRDLLESLCGSAALIANELRSLAQEHLVANESLKPSVPPSAEQAPRSKSERPPMWDSGELLQGHSEAWIGHGDQVYRLRMTSTGKLYLTK